MPDNAGELVPADLTAFTQERLDEDDQGTADALASALAAARRFCGWHVTPVRTDEQITLDGPGSALLVLPTLRLTAITELAEDGVALDVDDDIEWSTRGLVQKASRGWWSGKFGAITATISHGFDLAPDWQAAVLSFADRSSLVGVGGDPTVVGPFQWGADSMAASSAFNAAELSVLELYRLEPQP